MKFAVTLCALTILAQSVVPAFAQSVGDTETVANLPLLQQASVNVLGGEGAASAKHLQLSDAQKEKFFEIKNKMLADAGPKKVALAEQKRLLKDLLTKDTIDRKAVQSTQDKINSLKTDLANVMIASRLDMSEELTPEQRKVVRYRGLKSGGKHGHHGGGKMGKRHHRAFENSGDTIGSAPAMAGDDFVATNE
jgi:Spy/CpxP family protein refolding chaperone